MTRSSTHPSTDEPLDRPRDQVVGAPGRCDANCVHVIGGRRTAGRYPCRMVLAELVRDDGESMSRVIAVGAALVCTAIGALVATYPSLRTADPHATGS